jgi:hypothetical protein
MSDTKKKDLKLKLSLEKETLRVLDDSQLHLLDEVMGGLLDSCQERSCGTSNCNTSCQRDSCNAQLEQA